MWDPRWDILEFRQMLSENIPFLPLHLPLFPANMFSIYFRDIKSARDEKQLKRRSRQQQEKQKRNGMKRKPAAAILRYFIAP